MKRLAFILLLILGLLPLTSKAQDSILEEISEMDDVEVVYITKNMLKTIGNTNINIGGMNLTNIAKELNSLQIITAKSNAVAKARNKIKLLRKGDKMEIILSIKDENGRTDMFGIKSSSGNYNKLLTTIDDNKEITIIYMKGSMGKSCFEELAKASIRTPATNNNIGKKNSITSWNTEFEIEDIMPDFLFRQDNTTEHNNQSNDIETQIAMINHQIDECNKQANNISSSIDVFLDLIRNSSGSIRESYYNQRNKLYEERTQIYNKRNKLYTERNKLYEKRNKKIYSTLEQTSYNNNSTTIPIKTVSYLIQYNGTIHGTDINYNGSEWYLVLSTHSSLHKAQEWVRNKHKKNCYVLVCHDGKYRVFNTAGTYNFVKQKYNEYNNSNYSIYSLSDNISASSNNRRPVWVDIKGSKFKIQSGDENLEKWYLVANSLKTYQDAQKWIKSQKLNNATIQKGSNGWYRVCVERGTLEEMERVRDSGKYDKYGKCWITYKN